MSFHDRLVSELTQLDERKRARGRSWNPNFLGIALVSLHEVEEDLGPDASDVDVFTEALTPTRENHAIARRLGLGLDVVRGRWVVAKSEENRETRFPKADGVSLQAKCPTCDKWHSAYALFPPACQKPGDPYTRFVDGRRA